MHPSFHLSIGVKSIKESVEFFITVVGAKVLHRDPSGYVNIDLFGTQVTLKENSAIVPDFPDFHFGVNLSLIEFNRLSERVLEYGSKYVAMAPKVVDVGTELERMKMYLKCPTGYLIEFKGYKC